MPSKILFPLANKLFRVLREEKASHAVGVSALALALVMATRGLGMDRETVILILKTAWDKFDDLDGDTFDAAVDAVLNRGGK